MNKEKLISEIEKVYQWSPLLEELVNNHKRIIILGNGGSNAVASHICQDYTKQLKKPSFTFSDPSRLTCYINDYGMENANSQFLYEFAEPATDLIILMSSSGNSDNMVRAMEYCMHDKLDFIILTGFDESNKMRVLNQTKSSNKAKLDVWVNSYDYGIVECVHQIFLHSILGEK